MKIGITGGAGFIGSYVVDRAMMGGHEVVVFDKQSRLPRPGLSSHPQVSTFLGDVTNYTSMHELAAHVDGIIHLAACLGTQETIANPYPAMDTNILGGLNFLTAVAQYRIAGAYIGVGNHWMENTYSITKTTIERFVRMFNNERGTHVNVVRAVNAYGPGQSIAPPFGPAKVRKIMPSFVCRALTGMPIEIYGDGEQVSDMVYVTDVAEALVRALEHSAERITLPGAVEVGPAQSSTVNQIAEMVRQSAFRFAAGHSTITHLPMRPGEVPGATVQADFSSLTHLGMEEELLHPVRLGIPETVEWYAENWLPGWLERQA
jgi:UDP-glucose 4-epimerase